MSDAAADTYVRRCPGCGAENPPDVMRCACGSLLFGVDLVRPAALAPAATATAQSAATTAVPPAPTCPHEDCGQPNPPGSTTCLYCNRPLAAGAALTPAHESLLRLPGPLAQRLRIVGTLAACGAEAELLRVAPLAGGAQAIVKLYRPGIVPDAAVQARLAAVPARHRVVVQEAGMAEGHAFELMEYCAAGSLRELLAAGIPQPAELRTIVAELAAALAAVHDAGLVHRDVKPENVLLRSRDPLQLVLADFGIASTLEATQRFTGTARTLPYAPPESLSGVIDAKADYWALGMLLLEAATGRHPFAGLSEAVILHHLTTRSMDLSPVREAELRKLLRGLLLRDPAQRWGAPELARWLAGDPTLAEPREAGPGTGFAQPYHLGSEICGSREQLAVALSRHWKEGVADLANGQLLAWFRDVQKDQNTVRLLLELQYDRELHPDRQLLKLILHLASGLPPVWRGESLEPHAVLARANLALKGDAAAARWLDTLYRQRVLDDYAAAGNAELADMARRWSAAADSFAVTWAAHHDQIRQQNRALRNPDEVVLFDQAVYGQAETPCPPLLALHPRLLAIAYDPGWSERLRQRLGAELAGLEVHCPWLREWGDPAHFDAARLLVVEALVPELKKTAERQTAAVQRARDEDEQRRRTLAADVEAAVAAVAVSLDELSWTGANVDAVRRALDGYFEALAAVRAAGGIAAEWEAVRRQAQRREAAANRLRQQTDRLEERRAANAGWLSGRMLLFQLVALAILPEVLGAGGNGLLLALIPAILAWRLLPVYLGARRLREAAAQFRGG